MPAINIYPHPRTFHLPFFTCLDAWLYRAIFARANLLPTCHPFYRHLPCHRPARTCL